MPFSMSCIHKGCGQTQEPYIDPATNKVFCSMCDRELTNITHFVKVQMKSLKQFKPKQTKSFAIKCPSCNKEDRPRLVGNKIICIGCNKSMDHLSEPFKIMLREKLKTVDKDI